MPAKARPCTSRTNNEQTVIGGTYSKLIVAACKPKLLDIQATPGRLASLFPYSTASLVFLTLTRVCCAVSSHAKRPTPCNNRNNTGGCSVPGHYMRQQVYCSSGHMSRQAAALVATCDLVIKYKKAKLNRFSLWCVSRSSWVFERGMRGQSSNGAILDGIKAVIYQFIIPKMQSSNIPFN